MIMSKKLTRLKRGLAHVEKSITVGRSNGFSIKKLIDARSQYIEQIKQLTQKKRFK